MCHFNSLDAATSRLAIFFSLISYATACAPKLVCGIANWYPINIQNGDSIITDNGNCKAWHTAGNQIKPGFAFFCVSTESEISNISL